MFRLILWGFIALIFIPFWNNMAHMVLNEDASADERHPQPLMQKNVKRSSTKPYADYSSFQQIQIQRLRLKFLRECRQFKRPPTSLRIDGANAIADVDKLSHFSSLETLMLNQAIKTKLILIKDLVNKQKSDDTANIPLTPKDDKTLKEHFRKKLSFFSGQDTTKWKHWPKKPKAAFSEVKSPCKVKNFKKNRNRKRRKLEKNAKRILECGSVVILVNEDIPLGAISALGKGLGFIPTHRTDIENTRLDMRLTINRVLSSSRSSLNNSPNNSDTEDFEEPNIQNSERLPYKYARKFYGSGEPTSDLVVNDITNKMANDLDSRLRQIKPKTRQKFNLSIEEREGLKWLENMTNKNELSIVEADKGGAVLIVYPELLKKKVLEKLENPNLYKKLDTDPTQELHRDLFRLWVKGKENGFITSDTAKNVMGVSDNPRKDGKGPTNRPSTLPHYKPGTSYYYPSLKIHKLTREQLIPGVEPPVRLITALQDGVTKRSDVYLAEHVLKGIEKDFCGDLLSDTTDALRWLEFTNANFDHSEKSDFKSFTFDYKSLYDSLKPELVIEALREAMKECREGWSDEYCDWIIDLVKKSLESSVGIFDDNWYIQKQGVPTGGSLCVQLANITVFYIMRKEVYNNAELMKPIKSVKRYIDDGAGTFVGEKSDFQNWMNTVNNNLSSYGLFIDEHKIEDPGTYIAFLDIKFCFDIRGYLQTDLFVKETDSRSYLNFSSCHPKHHFSGVVYSQFLRLRRIINNTDRLRAQIEELKKCFYMSDYPKKLVNNIAAKVLTLDRSLERSNKPEADESMSKSVRLVSSFGSDQDIVRSAKKYEQHLSRTRSFSASESSHSPSAPSRLLTPTPSRTRSHSTSETSPTVPLVSPSPSNLLPMSTPKFKPKLFQLVKKTGASLRNRLVKVKRLATGQRYGRTKPCKCKNCKCCKLMSDELSFKINGNVIKVSQGTCASHNIIYLIKCTVPGCNKHYVGRSVRKLRVRIGEHRRAFNKILEGDTYDPLNDEFSLGDHLREHNFNHKDDFNKYYRVYILDICSPKSLEAREHIFIHKLNTLRPKGINATNPFGIPILEPTSD